MLFIIISKLKFNGLNLRHFFENDFLNFLINKLSIELDNLILKNIFLKLFFNIKLNISFFY